MLISFICAPLRRADYESLLLSKTGQLVNHFFTVFDCASALFVLLLIVVHAFLARHRHPLVPHYRFFLPSVYFKLLFALGFSLFYIVYYNGGGDTVAYWEGAVRLNDLFYYSPQEYFAEMLSAGDATSITDHFDKSIGYPPRWIYNEPESWLVCKILSLFIIIGFKGYLALTLVFAYMAHYAGWKLYELILTFGFHKDRLLAIAVLFIPSVAFWCSGVSKDTLLYISLMLFVTCLFRLLKSKKQWVGNVTGILVCSSILIGIRPVMFMAAAAPIAFALNIRILRRKAGSVIFRVLIQMTLLLFLGFIALFILTNGNSVDSAALNNMISEAAIVQKDFTNNLTYGENRYYLGITDYSVLGMTKVLPAAVIAGLYRPFLWEALTPNLILNGLESVFFIWVTLRFLLRRNLRKRLVFILGQELLIYLLLATIFTAFFSGYTSVIFGVLVRIRSFALPFLLVILFADRAIAEETPVEVPADKQ